MSTIVSETGLSGVNPVCTRGASEEGHYPLSSAGSQVGAEDAHGDGRGVWQGV